MSKFGNQPLVPMHVGIPQWILDGLNLPPTTQSVGIVASNTEYTLVEAKWYYCENDDQKNGKAKGARK
jgi:hypothetical protein